MQDTIKDILPNLGIDYRDVLFITLYLVVIGIGILKINEFNMLKSMLEMNLLWTFW